MAAPVVVMAAAAAVQIYGQISANKAQEKAEKTNAAVYAAQQRQAKLAMIREAAIYKDESMATIGETVTSLDRAGVDMTGSALLALGNMKEKASEEYKAILIGGRLNSQMIGMREAQSRRTAGLLGSTGYNATQGLGTALNSASTYLNNRPASASSSEGRSPSGDSYTGT